ncbi:hypothetical protein EFW58_03824 [Bacillus velezensis]|nr:hypothetical protein EFW58_03824 [Bacillus velezensis]
MRTVPPSYFFLNNKPVQNQFKILNYLGYLCNFCIIKIKKE